MSWIKYPQELSRKKVFFFIVKTRDFTILLSDQGRFPLAPAPTWSASLWGESGVKDCDSTLVQGEVFMQLWDEALNHALQRQEEWEGARERSKPALVQNTYPHFPFLGHLLQCVLRHILDCLLKWNVLEVNMSKPESSSQGWNNYAVAPTPVVFFKIPSVCVPPTPTAFPIENA